MTPAERELVLSAAQQLLCAAAQQKGPQHVLNVAYALLGLPIHLNSPIFQPIAACSGGLNLSQLARRGDGEDQESFREWMKTVKGSSEPVIDQQGVAGIRVMCYDVLVRGVEVGKLSLYETRPFRDSDAEILKLIAAALACVLGNDAHGSATLPDQAMINLMQMLISGHVDAQELQKIQRLFRIPAEGERHILVLRDMGRQTIEYPMLQDICFHRLGSDTILLEDTLVCLLEGPVQRETVESFLSSNRLRGGLSRTFSRLEALRDAHLQAHFALTQAEEQEILLMDYPNCLAQDVIAHCAKDRDLLTFCRPEVLRLWQYDRAHGTDYLQTLEAYCQCLCSSSETARSTFLHYNTVKYRLNLIRDISGFHHLTGQDLFEFWLSFRAIEAQEKTARAAQSPPPSDLF